MTLDEYTTTIKTNEYTARLLANAFSSLCKLDATDTNNAHLTQH